MKRLGFGQPARALALAVSTVALSVNAQQANEPGATVSGEKDNELVILDRFSVSTQRDYGYRSSNSIAATRTDTPIKDIPVNIQVFTKELVEDLGINNQISLEAYNASLVDGGADRHSDNVIQGSFNQFLFRGFQQNWELRDGVREYDPVDTQNLARVEVVKGPAAALYGLTYPGGIVQSITKTAEFDRTFANLRATIGGEGDYRATLDANFGGKLESAPFGVRVNGVYGRSKDERAHSAGRADLEAATIACEPRRSTRVELLIERGYRAKPNLGYLILPEFPDANGAPINGALIPLQITHPEIPWTWNWSNGKNFRSLETHLYRGTVTQRFGESLQVRAFVQYQRRDNIDADGWGNISDAAGILPMFQGLFGWNTGWIIDPETHAERIQSAYNYVDWSNEMHSYGVTGVYSLDFAAAKHTFAFGADVWTEWSLATGRIPSVPTYVTYPVQAYIPLPVPSEPPAALDTWIFYHQRNSNNIFFVNWQAAWWGDRLKTNVALSRTHLQLGDFPDSFNTAVKDFGQSQFSPLFGVVFALTKGISVFALRATSLFPDPATDSWYRHFPPVVGQSVEGGFKVDTVDGRLSGTVTCYDIRQSGGSQWDPTAPNAYPGAVGDNVPGGVQESKGVDVDLVYQPTRAWQFMLSYAHNEQQITQSAVTYTIGNTAPGHIKDRFVLVTKYTVPEGAAKGLYLGTGVSGGTKSLVDYTEWPENSGQFIARYLPGRATIEVFAGYRCKIAGQNALVQLNVKNLTRAPDYVGWKATGSPAVFATAPYRVPTSTVFRVTVGIDF